MDLTKNENEGYENHRRMMTSTAHRSVRGFTGNIVAAAAPPPDKGRRSWAELTKGANGHGRGLFHDPSHTSFGASTGIGGGGGGVCKPGRRLGDGSGGGR